MSDVNVCLVYKSLFVESKRKLPARSRHSLVYSVCVYSVPNVNQNVPEAPMSKRRVGLIFGSMQQFTLEQSSRVDRWDVISC